MASSYNQKSNSSASRAPKPTYRRAAAAKKAPASRKSSSAPQPAPVSRGAAKPRPVSARSQIARPASAMGVSKAKRPVPTKRGVVPGKSAKASARQRQLPHGTRPVASPAAVRAAEKKTSTAHVSSLTSGKKTAAKIVVPGVKRASMPAAGKPSSKKRVSSASCVPSWGPSRQSGAFLPRSLQNSTSANRVEACSSLAWADLPPWHLPSSSLRTLRSLRPPIFKCGVAITLSNRRCRLLSIFPRDDPAQRRREGYSRAAPGEPVDQGRSD